MQILSLPLGAANCIAPACHCRLTCNARTRDVERQRTSSPTPNICKSRPFRATHVETVFGSQPAWVDDMTTNGKYLTDLRYRCKTSLPIPEFPAAVTQLSQCLHHAYGIRKQVVRKRHVHAGSWSTTCLLAPPEVMTLVRILCKDSSATAPQPITTHQSTIPKAAISTLSTPARTWGARC